MNYTPKEIAELLKDKPHQPHYIEAMVNKVANQRIEDLEEVLRSLACWLGVGGFNSEKVTPDIYEQKIRFGVDMIIGVEKKRAVEKSVDKTALDNLCKKLGRFTADPLDLRLILEEAANEIERLRLNWQEDRSLLIKLMKERDENT